MAEQTVDKDQIWTEIDAILGEMTLSPEATRAVEGLIEQGLQRAAADDALDGRSAEVMGNYRFFAENLRRNFQGVKSSIDIGDIHRILGDISPLYPLN